MHVVRSSHRAGGEFELWIQGAFDAMTVYDIKAAFEAVVAEQPRLVIVDIDRVTMLDSSGVGALVSLYKRIKAQGGVVVVVGAHDQPLATLRLLKLEKVFGIA